MMAVKPHLIVPHQRPYPKIKRLRGRNKAVTIGIGFRCSDGIVLCADNQITWPQMHKYYECKLYPHRQHEWTAVFTFAGNPNLMKSFNDKFSAAMALVPWPYDVFKIRDVIETILAEQDILRDNPTELCLLCALAVPSQWFALFKTEGQTIHEVHGYDYVGVGDSSLLRYLGSLLTEIVITQGYSYGYITRQALILAIYLVLKAKVYVDGCGGDTDACIVRPSGPIEPTDAGMIYRTEQLMLKIESHIRKTAIMFFDKRITDEGFAGVLEGLIQTLKDEHFQFRIPAN